MARRFEMRAAAAALVILGVSTVSLPRARAGDPLAAQALYDEGKRLMGEKKYTQACAKFTESQRLDPGVGTHYALADCYEQSGRIATAWVTFLDVEQESKAQGRADRATVAKKRADTLAPRVPRITISVSDAARAPGLAIARDGQEVSEGQWGTPVPVDPGKHEIAAKAPGKREWKTSVEVQPDGRTTPVEVPRLENGPPTSPTATGSTAPASASASASAPPSATTSSSAPPPSSGWGAQKILGAAAFGVGVVGVGIGSVFGAQSFSKHSDASSHCNGLVCDATGLALINDGKSAASMANIFFIAGGALVVGGAVLWLTAPKPGAPQTGVRAVPLVGQRAGGVAVQGAW